MIAFHGGDVLAASARWGLHPDEILDFSANINPMGPPAGVLSAAAAALARTRHYPEPFSRTLRDALARRHGVEPEALLVGNGAAEVIHLLLRGEGGRRVALPQPGFAEYERAALAVGAVPVPYPAGPGAMVWPREADSAFGPDAPAPDIAVICNPHNPTGRLLTPEQLLACPARSVILDEAFLDLTSPGESASLIRRAPLTRNLAVVRSLTKFYAMPGLRVGYAVSHPDRIAALDAVRDPWSVGTPAQAAGLAALADEPYARATREWAAAERAFLAERLAALPGYTVCNPSANFILVQAAEPAWAIQERLGPLGILVRDCRSFAGLTDRHMRLAVRSRPENLRLLDALRG